MWDGMRWARREWGRNTDMGVRSWCYWEVGMRSGYHKYIGVYSKMEHGWRILSIGMDKNLTNWKKHVEEIMYIKLLALWLMNIIVLLLLAIEIIFQVGDTTLIGLSWTSLSASSPWVWDMLICTAGLFAHCLYSSFTLDSFSDLPSPPHPRSLCLCSPTLFSHSSILPHSPAAFLRKRGKKWFKKLATREAG